jgi:predicted metal-binding protein
MPKVVPDTTLRLYPARWKGQVLLACRTCQKKLKRSKSPAAKLKKSLGKLARKDPFPTRFHVIPVSCMKLCPGGGVAVCTRDQLQQSPPALAILRTKEDIGTLYEQCRAF